MTFYSGVTSSAFKLLELVLICLSVLLNFKVCVIFETECKTFFQVIVVKAPWIKHSILRGCNYILPRLDDVIVGGTAQKGDFCLSTCVFLFPFDIF